MGQRISSFLYSSPSVSEVRKTTDDLIGLNYESAEKYIKENSVYHNDVIVTSLREIASDNDILTTDIDTARIDVRVNEGIITEVIGY
jgi:hypothetical protein